MVVSKSLRFPFSKGILSQALIAAGMKPSEAYQVAEHIEEQLLKRKQQQIDKSRLKRMVYNQLKSTHGKELADKYLEWKRLASPIMVREGSSAVPFSKGILSQSLQAAGIEPNISHSLAITIERNLLNRESHEVARRELRDLTVETLRRKYGSSHANRYLLWRRLKKPIRPLIILIGGTAGTGKSTIGVELAHRLGITRVISTDSVREVMRIMFSTELMPTIHKSSFDAWQAYDWPKAIKDDIVIAAFMEQALRVSAGIYALMDRALNEKISTIIDGVHVVPGFIKRDYGDKALVCKLVVTTEDEDIHRERFVMRSEQTSTRGAEKYLRNFESIRKIQDFIVLQAHMHDIPVFDNESFDQTVATIVKYLTDMIKEHDKLRLHT
jgi:2-phosphoglycerate kinase